MPKTVRLLLLLILAIAFYLRFFGINWDYGFHLHPDERMIIMVADRIKIDSLNPKFFAYGSFPIYLLAGISSIFNQGNYDGMLYVGRALSVLFDVLTVFVIYHLTLTVFGAKKHKAALLSSFFYTISVLPIQAAHFYAVDTTLTFLSTLTFFVLIKFYLKPTIIKALLTGFSFGLAIATKITILLLIVPITITLLLIGYKSKSLKKFFILSLFTFSFLLLTFFLAMPYAIIDRVEFIKQISMQLKMNSDPYIFPFTLQYVGTTPYIYYLKNIILWGFGIPLGVFLLLSVLYQTLITIKKLPKLAQNANNHKSTSTLIILVFFWLYFLIVGKSAVKFMRYMLPLYPLFCIFGGIFVIQLISKLKQNKLLLIACYLLLATCLIWPLSFITIYTNPPTRVEASNWIVTNIKPESVIAVEHWDDRLPLFQSEKYRIIDLPLYETDTPLKWQDIAKTLSETDYIVIASNRLYTPLQKLDNCAIHKSHCYPFTKNYYQMLFNGKLGFNKISEFVNIPTIPFTSISFNDESSDESFTVYDHPKIMIFSKENDISSEELFTIITKQALDQ